MVAQRRLNKLPRKLSELRRNFQQMCRNDVPGVLAARTYSQALFKAFQESLSSLDVSAENWVLMAVGGFGRGEMSFLSDLDLFFLYRRKLPSMLEEVIQELVYGLWDADFEVGHVTASVSAVKQLMRDDFSVETTYLDPKFIAGDRVLYEEWLDSVLKSYGPQKRKRFLRSLIEYREQRLVEYGESSYLLEPHVKEGIGGLRDLHLTHWAGMVFLQDGSFRALRRNGWLAPEEELWAEQSHDFLWRVRLQLHQLNGRRQDQLLLADQENLAARLGFLDGVQGTAVEAFMRFYYRHTARIRRVASFLLERLEESQLSTFRKRMKKRRILPGPFLLEGHRLQFMEPELIPQNPGLLMRFFWQVAESGAYFHHHMGQIIRGNLSHFAGRVREDQAVTDRFFDILVNREHGFRVLKAMMETGFLEAFIPEFTAVRYRVQHDVYHLYTVDEHLLRTVRELHRMAAEKDDGPIPLEFGEIFEKVENPRILFLAALIHDLGKGQGKNHSARGAVMAKSIGARLNLEPEEVDLLEYLVANHLLLAETALKRDLSDEKPIFRCAVEVADRERLRLLYLLTIADSRATGPGAWNTWRASLLRELYIKVDHILYKGDWTAADVEEQTRVSQRDVLALLAADEGRDKVAKWLEGLSFRYMMSQDPEAIVHHYRMEQSLKKATVVVSAEPAEGEMWQVTLAARDQPGLFACIAGVLWVHGLNILSADIFTRSSGVALDVIAIERVPDPLHARELWDGIEKDLALTIEDRQHLKGLVKRERRSPLLAPRQVVRKEDRVVIDEEASDFYTVVEVYTWDRPGVLHAISNTFFELDISIQLAKISTPGAQVVDVFYVTDLGGNKLLDADIHNRVQARLLECLGSF